MTRYAHESGHEYNIREVAEKVYLVEWDTGEVDVHMARVDGFESTTIVRSGDTAKTLSRYVDKYARRKEGGA